MTSKVPFYLGVLLLIITGLALSIMRHTGYGVPWTPGETRQIWDIEARIEFTAQDDPVRVSLASPSTQSGFTLLGESTSSPGYGVSYVDTNAGHRTEWSIRRADGQQILYYKAQLLVDDYATQPATTAEPQTPEKPIFTGPRYTAAEALLQQATERSADNITLTRELLKQLNDRDNQNAALLLNDKSKVRAAADLLSYAGVINRYAGVLQLEDGRRRQQLTRMLQVWDGDAWQLFDVNHINPVQNKNLLIWDQSNVSLLDVIGGKNSRVYFSMIAEDITPQQATRQKVDADNLLNFSIHSLPIAEQSMFKTIMLIPIGALIVVFLRVIIGLKTSGTFMPVLIAVAFFQTQLLAGILGFLLIVGTGLIIRSYLSRLNLLLVARISAVIISVILIISLFTIVAFNIGLNEGLTITFFPMIILSWTIERMSILWEEEGGKEVFVQGGGSLLTAVLVYLAMTNGYIQHLTFNFIGLQLVILAAILLLGTYTGYRVTELRRFTPLSHD
jgi:hypothetical protein